MTGRLIEEACSLAISIGDIHLALLLSQAIGSDDVRHLMRRQLAAWAETKVFTEVTLQTAECRGYLMVLKLVSDRQLRVE